MPLYVHEMVLILVTVFDLEVREFASFRSLHVGLTEKAKCR